MNDTAAVKTHRPAGYVDSFFQMFDWNRSFAKKKLFSKKLLPPATTKKFGGDEMLPKLRLIADENSGGFPNVIKNGTHTVECEQKHRMWAPSLVARLMGLESMPSVQQNKFVSDCHESGKDNGDIKHELRPQKLQKTGPYERQPVNRFGAEALQFKNVLSRSRKHHPKLASPVKSPRSLSSRNASQLIGAATKILEPGLQSRNRDEVALTYSMHTPKDEAMLEEKTALSKSSDYYVSAAKSLKGQTSCRNYGNFQDTVDIRPNMEEQQSVFISCVSNYVNPSSRGTVRNKARSPMSSIEQEKERVIQMGHKYFASLTAQAMEDVRPYTEPISDWMPLDQEGQCQWHLTSQQYKAQKDSPPSICSKHKSQRQNQVSLGRGMIPPRSKLGNLQGNRVALTTGPINDIKDFIALNPRVCCRSCLRMPTKVDNFKFDTERKFGNMRDDSFSPVWKRRSMNVSRQGESSAFVSSTFNKQKNRGCNAMTGKEMGLNTPSMNSTYIKSRSAHLGEINGINGFDNDAISFTFSSPVNHKSDIPDEIEKRRDQIDSTCNDIPHTNSILDENDGNGCSQKLFPLKGDTLGALLEQKLKELTCQEEHELALGDTQPIRTSAMILQELIYALTAERPYQQDNLTVRYDSKDISCYRGHMSNTNTDITFQAKPKTAKASVRHSHDSDRLSPGSILEASFSNERCFSSSLDGNSGHKLHTDSMGRSYDKSQPLEPEADLLDSATSLSNGKNGREMVTDLLNHISETLCSIDLAGARLKGVKLIHAKDVILNAGLVLHNSDKIKGFSITHFLLDELETLATLMWKNLSSFPGFEYTGEGNLHTGFLFDSVVEYLESRYGQPSKSGFTRLPLRINDEMLIGEVVEEVRRWTSLGGLLPDELIEREMSCKLGKWTDFEIEAFETSVEMDGDILQNLVDEVVVDLWECRLGT